MLPSHWLSFHMSPSSIHSAWLRWPTLLPLDLSTNCSVCLELVFSLSLANSFVSFLPHPLKYYFPEQPSDHPIKLPPASPVTMLIFPVLMLSEIFFLLIYLFISCFSHGSTCLPRWYVPKSRTFACLVHCCPPGPRIVCNIQKALDK